MMLIYISISVVSLFIVEGKHFNGGTINWAPIDPCTNSSTVGITITQSYSWAYPTITCANNVPITTSGRSTQNWNLICVVDCTTDGGYSLKQIDILTDCTSVSTALGMMSSQRSHNLTLNASAHFYLANRGSAWVALNYPTQSGLEWSIVTLIDLRLRLDGFINTPPIASVVSPQYAIVNRTIEINIPVSDVNVGDDVRCRWSVFTPGYRRRRSDDEKHRNHRSTIASSKRVVINKKLSHIRKKRTCGGCSSSCGSWCDCTCSSCLTDARCVSTTTISTTVATTIATTVKTTTTTTTTSTTATTATTESTTVTETTTIDTPGVLKSTSTYPHRQAIDECGDICYPSSLPNGTSMSNCTITFTGMRAGVWYAVAIQVEDFIDSSSTVAMSSVPVQFLIYVQPQPTCSQAPIIILPVGCLEVQVGTLVKFNLTAINLCNSSSITLTDIVISSGINGMTKSNLTKSSTNSSIYSMTFTWTPQQSQVGLEELCTIAFTSERLQSDQYCVTFTVKNSSDVCVTTSTSTTSTSSSSTTSTSATTITTTTTTTSKTTTTSSETTSTSTSSTSTSSTTSSTSTSTSSTTSTTTSSTSISTTTTSSSTTTTSVTTSTVTTTTVTTATTTKVLNKSPNWLLILGMALLALLLAICCSCCCLYWFLWGPGARRRRKKQNEDDPIEQPFAWRNTMDPMQHRRALDRIYQPRTSINNSSLMNSMLQPKDSARRFPSAILQKTWSDSATTMTNVEGSRILSTVSVKRIRRNSLAKMNNSRNPDKIKNFTKTTTTTNYRDNNEMTSIVQRSRSSIVPLNQEPSIDAENPNNLNRMSQKTLNTRSAVSTQNISVNLTKIPKHRRAASVGKISVRRLSKSSFEMQPIANRSNTPSMITNSKINTHSGVVVTRVSKKVTSN